MSCYGGELLRPARHPRCRPPPPSAVPPAASIATRGSTCRRRPQPRLPPPSAAPPAASLAAHGPARGSTRRHARRHCPQPCLPSKFAAPLAASLAARGTACRRHARRPNSPPPPTAPPSALRTLPLGAGPPSRAAAWGRWRRRLGKMGGVVCNVGVPGVIWYFHRHLTRS